MTIFGYFTLLLGVACIIHGAWAIKKKHIFYEGYSFDGIWALVYGIISIVTGIVVLISAFNFLKN